ncbi:MAG: type II toxin-antitoxin system VapC family toxin [Anaerolineae bacterium]|nr:type II toxin-antitoxin system VapC family toxin [Anaerolineae bacterium]
MSNLIFLDLFEEYQGAGLKPRDAIHAATMRNNGLRQLISADKDFDVLDFIVRVDPAAYTPAP